MNSLKQLVFAILTIVFATSAEAQIDWHWQINNPNRIASPTETVTFTATIFNEVTSTADIIFNRESTSVGFPPITLNPLVTLSAYGNFLSDYDTINSINFNLFDNLTIAPAESYTFLYVSLKPKNSFAKLGLYSSLSNFIYISSIGGNGIDVGSYQVTVVPEPTTYALMVGGLFLLGLSARYKVKSKAMQFM